MNFDDREKQDVYLVLKNLSGSVEHYFHFLLGFLVPLILWRKANKRYATKRVWVRSCGTLDKHLRDLDLEGVAILEKDVHCKLRSKRDFSKKYEFVEKKGYDGRAHFNQEHFSTFKSELSEILSVELAICTVEIKSGSKSDYPCIVMIDRDFSDRFFTSPSCEIGSSGRSRRSIPNFEELCGRVRARYENVIGTTLEDKSLAFQMSLFKEADIIVAQHGAALANLIACQPGTILIEISPLDLPGFKNHFMHLADCMNLDYLRLDQDESHSDVDPDSLMHSLDIAVKRFEKLSQSE